MIDIEYETFAEDVQSGEFRRRLETELRVGFEEMHQKGERLPPVSYYASRIAEIVDLGSDEPIDPTLSFDVYQEIHAACESARKYVLGEDEAII